MKNKIKISFIFLFVLLLVFYYASLSIISIEIIKVTNDSDIKSPNFIGENYKIIIKKKFYGNEDKGNEALYTKNYNSYINVLHRKDSFGEIYNKYIKKINSSSCICIYNKPDLKFNEINPLKLETNYSKHLNLDIINIPLSNIKYKSNHPEIVKVNNEGKITAIRPGNAIITAYQLGYKSAKLNVISKSTEGLINRNILDLYNANKFKNIMIVAHPDDETLWGGANLIKENYFVISLTNNYNLVRAKEFMQIMNFTNNSGILLDYPDTQDDIIDNWSEVEIGILKDLTTILNYKNWEKIVTYGPDGTYGHIHHKKTSKFVTLTTKKLKKFNKLYYFGKYYDKDKIPSNLPKISDKELQYKIKEISFYKSAKEGIDKYLIHVLPYERFILASNIKNEFI